MQEPLNEVEAVEIHDRIENNKANLNRIRRIQGQLDSLARLLEADKGTCYDRVIRARTIEKGVSSLITHMVECYLECTARPQMESDPDAVSDDIAKLFKLLNK